MNPVHRKYLIDIWDAITHIETFLGLTTTVEEYQKNLLVRRAVERELEIIGEAAGRLLKTDAPPAITHAHRIVDLRNRVIHGYDTVDDMILWGVIQQHLPSLKQEVEILLNQSNG